MVNGRGLAAAVVALSAATAGTAWGAEPVEENAVEERSGGFAVNVLVGETATGTKGLNRWLARDGFAPLSETCIVGGIGFEVSAWRLRFGGDIAGGRVSTRHDTTGDELSAGVTLLTLFVGFEVFRYRNSTWSLSSGIAAKSVGVDGRTPGFTGFASQLEDWERGNVAFEGAHLPLEASYDYMIPIGNWNPLVDQMTINVGFRAGYLAQLGGSWRTRDEDSRDLTGPDLETSGPHFRFVLGLGGFE